MNIIGLQNFQKAQSAAKTAKYISLDEINQHNKAGDCWIVIHQKVYDVSKYMMQHPGGFKTMLDHSGPGQNATNGFYKVGHSGVAKKIMEKYFIGYL